MAYYRRRTYRRRPYRPRVSRKRTYRRKFSRFGKRKMNTNVYYFKRRSTTVWDWVNGSQVTQLNQATAGINTAYNLSFRLVDVPGYTDFTNVYDQYRIRAVKVNLIPIGNISSSNTAGGITGPAGNYAVRCYSAFDPNYDGVGVIGATATVQLQEYQNCKWTPYNRIHKRYIKPKIVIQPGTGGATTTVNMAGKQPWIQCSGDGPSLIHYGLPVAIDATGFPEGSIMYKVECTYYMQFARPK